MQMQRRGKHTRSAGKGKRADGSSRWLVSDARRLAKYRHAPSGGGGGSLPGASLGAARATSTMTCLPCLSHPLGGMIGFVEM